MYLKISGFNRLKILKNGFLKDNIWNISICCDRNCLTRSRYKHAVEHTPTFPSLRNAAPPPQSWQLKLQVIVCAVECGSISATIWARDLSQKMMFFFPDMRHNYTSFSFFLHFFCWLRNAEATSCSSSISVSLINLTPVTSPAFTAPVSRDGWVLMSLYSLLGVKTWICSIFIWEVSFSHVQTWEGLLGPVSITEQNFGRLIYSFFFFYSHWFLESFVWRPVVHQAEREK